MHNPARILIVDDNETNRDILVTRLSKHGYETLQAADGEEALATAMQHRPDLMLLDVEMPKLDGFEVCRRLKKDPAMPFMPIILCTARAASQAGEADGIADAHAPRVREHGGHGSRPAEEASRSREEQQASAEHDEGDHHQDARTDLVAVRGQGQSSSSRSAA